MQVCGKAIPKFVSVERPTYITPQGFKRLADELISCAPSTAEVVQEFRTRAGDRRENANTYTARTKLRRDPTGGCASSASWCDAAVWSTRRRRRGPRSLRRDVVLEDETVRRKNGARREDEIDCGEPADTPGDRPFGAAILG
jgi:hypothetical protein